MQTEIELSRDEGRERERERERERGTHYLRWGEEVFVGESALNSLKWICMQVKAKTKFD